MDIDRRTTPRTHHIRVIRTARFYTLGGGSFAPRDVWFVLHGYGQLAGEFVRFFADLANDDTLVVAPEALSRYYVTDISKAAAKDRRVGSSWMTREDRDAEIEDYVDYLDALYEEVASGPVREGARVNVIGFSQGAATAARWVTDGRASISRLVVWGGLLPPDTDLSDGVSAIRGARLTLIAGTRDHYVDAAALAAEQARLNTAGIAHDTITFDGGHVISRLVFPQLLGAPAAQRGSR
jgi:predicted esterase